MSFCIGQKFPRIALCFIFELGNKRIGYFSCEVRISINGQTTSNREQYFLSVSGDLVWLYHQENLIDINTYLLHEQNHVEVSCEIFDASKGADVTICFSGVHEYKEDDEAHEYQCQYEDKLETDCCTFPENLRLHEVSDEKLQQLSASISSEMLEDNGSMPHKNGKATDIFSDDTIHQRKEICSLNMQLYDDRIWDPMLLECQLLCMNEKNKGKSEWCLTSL